MPITVDDIYTPVTKDQALQLIIDELASLGFNTTSWQPGSEQRTLVEVFAQMYASLTVGVSDIAKTGFNEDAIGQWLDVLSSSFFNNTRNAAVPTQGTLLMTCASGSGPYTIDTGSNQITVQHGTLQYRYFNITGGTLNGGSTLGVTLEAEVAAANRDVEPDTITELVTALAGVTVSNPIPSGETTWITQNGAGKESDDSLREDNALTWTTIAAAGPPEEAYVKFARDASSSVTRAQTVEGARGAGTVNLYCAGQSGPSADDVVDTVDDYVRGVTDGEGRRILNMNLLTLPAIQRTIPVVGTIYMATESNDPTNQQVVLDAIQTVFSNTPIGGKSVTGVVDDPKVFAYIDLLKALGNSTGVIDVALTSPTANIILSDGEVAVQANDITFVPV